MARVVVGDQNGSAGHGRFLSCASSGALRVLHRQQHAEHGALGLDFALDDAAVVADDLGDQRQPEAGAVALGGHERIEQVRLEVLGDARAVVLDLDHQRQADARAGARHGQPHARAGRPCAARSPRLARFRDRPRRRS